jgi:hypothetical protein
MRGAPVVEQFLASRPGVYNAEEQAWIRRHPSFAVDPAFQQRIAAEYNAAQAEGFRPGSAALVAKMDRIAADMGIAADHGPAPMLSLVSARRLGMGGLSKIMIKKRICASIAAVKGSGGAPGVKNTVAEIVRRTRAEQLGRANREVPDLSA